MNRVREWLARFGELFRRGRIEQDLGDELQTHLDLLAEEHMRRGLSPADARAAATREFGGVAQTAEAVRDRRGLPSIERVIRDVRYAGRLLRRAPGFTATAVATLALGIGANTAIFSLVDAAMLRPLPYSNPGRLVAIWELSAPSGRAPVRTVVAPANFVDYRRAASLSGVAAFTSIGATLTGAGDPERLLGEEVTAGYFETLGAAPALGRPIGAVDTEAAGRPVVVLSHGLWRDRFGARTDVIGQSVTLDSLRVEVIGVMPPEFIGVTQIDRSDPVAFWTPMVFDPGFLASRHDHTVNVVARLASDRSVAQARDELRAIAGGFTPAGSNATLSVDVASLQADVARNVRTLLVLLVGAVGLVLLLACANVASLLVVRSAGRRREIAVRVALGATRTRIVRELVTQSLVLATFGGLAGWALAAVLKNVLVSVTPTTMPRLAAVALDGRVLLFTAGLAAITGIAFGLLPAWQLSRTAPSDALGAASRAVTGHWGERSRRGLIVVEAALSVLLLVGAGLMIRSLSTLNRVDLGFDPRHILAANVSLPASRYSTPAARLDFFERLEGSLRAVPGIRAVAFANRLPLRGIWSSGFAWDPQHVPAGSKLQAAAGFQSVSPGYFAMFGLQALRGRVLEATDRDGRPPVAVVNEQFSRVLLQGGDPLGRRLRRHDKAPWIEIVGVVRDIRREGPTGEGGGLARLEPQVYLAAAQTALYPLSLSDVAVQDDGRVEHLAATIRNAVWSIDRDQPVARLASLERALSLRQSDRQFQTLLFALFAALALILAVVGIYGVVTYAVSQRTAEIGLRLALGAEAGAIVRWMVRQSLLLVVIGAALGLGAALSLSRSIQALLFETSPADPVSYAAATAALMAAATTACYVAARRASRVDPAQVLR